MVQPAGVDEAVCLRKNPQNYSSNSVIWLIFKVIWLIFTVIWLIFTVIWLIFTGASFKNYDDHHHGSEEMAPGGGWIMKNFIELSKELSLLLSPFSLNFMWNVREKIQFLCTEETLILLWDRILNILFSAQECHISHTIPIRGDFKTLPKAQRTQKLTTWLGLILATSWHPLY